MKHITLLMLVFLSAGCSTFSPPVVQPTSTSAVVDPMETVTSTSLPGPTPTIEVLTSSPLPTLPSAEAEAMILDLLQNNGGCLLPCWWGLTPGKTTYQVAQAFLARLETDSSRIGFYDDRGGASWFIENEDMRLDIITSFIHHRAMIGIVESFRITMEVKREQSEGGFETVWENPLNERYLQAYMLPQILSVYGQPKEVFVFANEGWRYFSLVLDYSDRGFAVWYSAPLESSGDKYLGCMAKAFTRLYLWVPEFSYTWAEGVTGNGDEYEINSLNRDFQSLEKVTSLTTEEFYSIFTTTGTIPCLETSKQLWPGP